MKQLLMSLCLMIATLTQADTVYAEPEPSFMAPRQILFSMVGGSDEQIHHVLSSANNVLKEYGPENVHMRIVAYSQGIRGVLKKDKEIAVRVQALMQYNVEFVACENTLRTKKIDASELIEGTEVVTAGIVEIVERVKEGWIYVRP
jgi:uncharacterized protein